MTRIWEYVLRSIALFVSCSKRQSTSPAKMDRTNYQRLPTELYRNVVEFVTSRDDLESLLLSSHTLHEEALRMIWGEIDMRPERGGTDLKAFVIQKFERIKRTPYLATYVRKLIFYRSVIKNDLYFLFPLMTNIRHLCFVSAPHPIFNDCSLRLASFYMIGRSNHRRGELVEWIKDESAKFLADQHSLTELAIPERVPLPIIESLPTTTFPRLNTLTFHAGPGLALLLRGRRVSRLNALHLGRLNLCDIQRRDASRLRVLVCHRVVASPAEYAHLANLEYLQCSHRDHRYDASWKEQIGAMGKLRKLVIADEESHFRSYNIDDEVAGLFGWHLGIQWIEIRNGNAKPHVGPPTGSRKQGVLYERGGRKTTLSNVDWDEWKTFLYHET